jgi:hypothetical protein
MPKSVAIIFRKAANWTTCTIELFLPSNLAIDQQEQLHQELRTHFANYTLEILNGIDAPPTLAAHKKLVSGSILHRGAIFNIGYDITISGEPMYNQIIVDIKENVLQFCRRKSYQWVIDGDVFQQQTSNMRF